MPTDIMCIIWRQPELNRFVLSLIRMPSL